MDYLGGLWGGDAYRGPDLFLAHTGSRGIDGLHLAIAWSKFVLTSSHCVQYVMSAHLVQTGYCLNLYSAMLNKKAQHTAR